MSGSAPDEPGTASGATPSTAAPTVALDRVDASMRADWLGRGLRFVSQAGDAPALVVDGDGVTGPSPMQLLLHSLAACTASDVVDILGKMRVSLSGLTLRVTATRAPEPPRRFTAIHLSYETRGLDPADEGKLRRALALSHEKYCSVLHSLREDIEIRTEVEIS